MSRRAEYHTLHRFVVTPTQVETIRGACSKSDRFTWVTIGPKGKRVDERLRVHTLKGVPSKHLDLLIPDVVRDGDLICEIGVKVGCFDAAKRFRITFRWWPHICSEGRTPSTTHPGPGKIVLEDEGDQTAVICLFWGQQMWANSFPRLKFVVDVESNLHDIFMWQWKHHYRFIPEEDAQQDAEVWMLMPEVRATDDLVLLNRTASRMLYERARQLGWRKLTLRERRRCNLSDDATQWQRIDGLALKGSRFDPSTNGAGQYTNEAANGRVPMHHVPETIATAHGIIEVE